VRSLRFSETSAEFHRTARCCIPCSSHRYENFKSNTNNGFVILSQQDISPMKITKQSSLLEANQICHSAEWRWQCDFTLFTPSIGLLRTISKHWMYFNTFQQPIPYFFQDNRKWVYLRGSLLSIVYMHSPILFALKNAIFWDVTPRSSCKNRRFGGT
jgi:hypothetical protein